MAEIKLQDMIETVELTTKDLIGGSYKTKDKVFYDTLKDVENISDSERIAYATDYAVMNYGLLSNLVYGYKDKKPTWYWLRSASSGSTVRCVHFHGNHNGQNCSADFAGIRPNLHLNLSSFISAQKNSPDFFKIEEKSYNGIEDYHTLVFGYYPKTYVGNKLNSVLESYYSSKTLKATGRRWRKKWNGYQNDDGTFVQNEEFEYKGERYVRVKTQKYDNNSEYSDGTEASERGTYKWIKVEPIVWKIRNWDEMPSEINSNGNGRAKFIDLQAEDCITSGIPFSEGGVETFWKDSSIRDF